MVFSNVPSQCAWYSQNRFYNVSCSYPYSLLFRPHIASHYAIYSVHHIHITSTLLPSHHITSYHNISYPLYQSQQASRDAVTTQSFFDTLLEALPSPKKTSSKRALSVPDVGYLLGACTGVKGSGGENNSSIGGNMTLIVRDDVSLAVIRLCAWNESATSVDAGVLRSFLCVLSSYRVLQKRLQVCALCAPQCSFLCSCSCLCSCNC